MPDLLPDQTGAMAAIATAVAAIGAAAYKFTRQVKTDRQSDQRAESHQDLVEALQETIDKQNKRIDELTTRVDAMAKERNEALIEKAEMKGEVKRLEMDVDRLTKELASALLEIENLKRVSPKPWKPSDPDRRGGDRRRDDDHH